MKKYINQIFYEGLGVTLYKPIENIINKIKNNKINNIFIAVYKIVYLLFTICLALLLLYYKLK